MITQGLLLWPYFTFARLIAPYVSPGKGQEYRESWGALILLLVCASTLITAFHCRGRSSPSRTGLVLVALVIGLWGTIERWNSGWIIGVVREWAPAGWQSAGNGGGPAICVKRADSRGVRTGRCRFNAVCIPLGRDLSLDVGEVAYRLSPPQRQGSTPNDCDC